ncbi:hypothetical protein OIU78_024900, partial [Salix suchowensis]
MQNIVLSSVMQSYTNSYAKRFVGLPSVPGLRETDLPYSPFPVTQSLPTKIQQCSYFYYCPSISMSGGFCEQVVFLRPSQLLRLFLVRMLPLGPALPQHLAVHPYQQPAPSFGTFCQHDQLLPSWLRATHICHQPSSRLFLPATTHTISHWQQCFSTIQEQCFCAQLASVCCCRFWVWIREFHQHLCRKLSSEHNPLPPAGTTI